MMALEKTIVEVVEDAAAAELRALDAMLANLRRAQPASWQVTPSDAQLCGEARLLAHARNALALKCRLGSADRRLDAYFGRGTGAAPTRAATETYLAQTTFIVERALADGRNRRLLAQARPAVRALIDELAVQRAALDVVARRCLAA
jgi:hypothetical protein